MQLKIKSIIDGRFVLLDPVSEILDDRRQKWTLYLPQDGRVILLLDDRRTMISVEMKDILTEMISDFRSNKNGFDNETNS